MQTHDQNQHQDPQQKKQQIEDPNNPGFDMEGNPMEKSNVWTYLLFLLLAILIAGAVYLAFFSSEEDEQPAVEETEQPIINDPGNTLPAPIDSTDIKRAEKAEKRAEEAEAKQAELAKKVAQLDSLLKNQPPVVNDPNAKKTQPGITNPGNGQQQPGNGGQPNAGQTAKGGNDVPTIPGLTVIETCLTARPAVGVVYWCRDTKQFQYRKSQKLQLPGKEWPK